MHAIRQDAFGPADQLVLHDLPDLQPGPGEVRIDVQAAGVHLIDTRIRAGIQMGAFPLPTLPMTPGREVAGVVDEVGVGVDGSWLGKRVAVHLGEASGGYADQAVASAEGLHDLGPDLSFEAAVATLGTGRTVAGVLGVAELQPDDVVLVTSAAGGMGTFFVQAVRNLGATVVGVAGGAAKVDLVRSLGADVAVDYLADDWDEQVVEALDGRKLTVVLDGVGGDVATRAVGLLAPGGRVVVHGWASGTESLVGDGELAQRGVTSTTALGPRMFQGPDGPITLRDLEEQAFAEVASHRWLPVVHPPFPLADAAEAHRAIEGRRVTGKVVLAP